MARGKFMPIPSVEHWEENARLVEVLAEGMGGDPTRLAMPETAGLLAAHQAAGTKRSVSQRAL